MPASALRTQAIQIAKNFTGRSKIMRVLPGWSQSMSGEFQVEEVAPLKRSALCQALAESETRIAAIVAGPLEGNSLVVKRYLKRVREMASAEGALLIWDSAGSKGGAPEFVPDLSIAEDPNAEGTVILTLRPDLVQGGFR